MELRGFEPLTPCMPLTSQPLAPQHASTRCLISVLLSTQIAMKRHGAGCGDVRLGCWQIAGSAGHRRRWRHRARSTDEYAAGPQLVPPLHHPKTSRHPAQPAQCPRTGSSGSTDSALLPSTATKQRSRELLRLDGGWLTGQDAVELAAGADAELGEHLAEVPFDGARADEQLGADLGVGMPVGGEAGDLRLLRGELVAGRRRCVCAPSRRWPAARARARSANASMPHRVNISWAMRSCSRASMRRRSRRSHSP